MAAAATRLGVDFVDPSELDMPAADDADEDGVAQKRARGVDASRSGRAPFPKLKPDHDAKVEYRSIAVPTHRLTPLKQQWMSLYTPIVENLKLDVRYAAGRVPLPPCRNTSSSGGRWGPPRRMNTRRRCVEVRTSKHTEEVETIQKAADFLKAFMLGFEVSDALALVRLDDLYVESFEVSDVKMLRGDHLSRAIGRVAGKDGKTKNAIENATRTRIVLADTKVHILGSVAHIRVARDAVCSLIMGSPPGKVYNSMRTTASRLLQRF